MESIQLIFMLSTLLLAAVLTAVKTKGDRTPVRGLKFLGILVSSVPIIGVIQGIIVRKRLPLYSDACFIQAIYCGIGYVIITQVLPKYA
ncbi:hypothetical protein [Zooshikella ganghwensis]|uniref:hypothetical protein n=1 Tax=Zooshikella ganghwensis TaxID=202772 RepID=UPI0004879D19|nr:hypothetical protein [Zooshikella ganghwensis]